MADETMSLTLWRQFQQGLPDSVRKSMQPEVSLRPIAASPKWFLVTISDNILEPHIVREFDTLEQLRQNAAVAIQQMKAEHAELELGDGFSLCAFYGRRLNFANGELPYLLLPDGQALPLFPPPPPPKPSNGHFGPNLVDVIPDEDQGQAAANDTQLANPFSGLAVVDTPEL